MRPCSYAVGVIIGVVLLAVGATGCTKIAGTPVADTASGPEASKVTMPPATLSGDPVGTAVMKVSGGSAPVTIRYRINEGPEQTEANVTLPWEKEYLVYDKMDSQVAADGGDAELICTITMNGDKLVSFKSEPRPTCDFAYWG